jgi:hypothetical protein
MVEAKATSKKGLSWARVPMKIFCVSVIPAKVDVLGFRDYIFTMIFNVGIW